MSQSWKSLCTSAVLLLSLTACGTAPQAPTSTASVPTAPEQSSGRIGEASPTKTNARSSFYQSNEANGSGQTRCAGTINGVEKKGSSASECKALKSEFAGSNFNGEDGEGAAAEANANAADGQYVCSFNIDGKLYEGKSQAECEKLQKALGLSFDFPEFPPFPEVPQVPQVPQAPNIPAPPAQPNVPNLPSPQGGGVVSCSYNIDGKLYEGRSQAECDKLKKDLGLQF